jgi:hypothetical protein
MGRTVTARLCYDVDRSMVVVLDGPDGPVEVGRAFSTTDVGLIAFRGAQEAYGDDDVEVALLAERPPWLREGDVVRIDPAGLEEGQTHPYGQVVGFLPVGGVLVVHPESGAGVQQPEHLDVVDPTSLPAEVVQAIVERSGRTP